MTTRKAALTALVLVWAIVITLGLNYANTPIREALSVRFPGVHDFVYDIFSDAAWLFVGLCVAVISPRFFGYQVGEIFKHKKLLLVLLAFFISAPLSYRLLAGNTPFHANTWFFEGVVVPLTEEGFNRGIILTMLLWSLGKLYQPRTAQIMAVTFGALIFGLMHLNNLGTYPASFIFFQAFSAIIFGILFGYSRVKTNSNYPAILLHAVLNLVATL